MATQVSLNSGAVASAGTLALQTNGTTEAVSISTGQVATLAQNPILTSGTANGVAYLNGSKAVTSGSALTFDGTNFATTGTASATKMIPTGGSATGNGMYLPASNTLAWSNNGSETMRLDSAGNLGLGVTPSAWTAGRTALQIYGSSTAVYFAGATTNTVFANNYYYNAGDKFVSASGYAQNYQQQSGGSHVWLTSSATSGGAGATATMNTLMTLDASGNLGIGTTSPAGLLEVRKDQNSATYTYITNQSTGASGQAILRMANSATGMNLAYTSSGYSTVVNYDVASGGYLASAGSGGLSLAATDSTAVIRFYSGGTTERARIDASGNFLVGKSSNSVSSNGNWIAPTGETFHTIPSGSNTLHVYSSTASAYRFYVGANGTISATNTTITSLSDQRLKENIRDLDDGLDAVMALKPRKFDWKPGQGKDIANDRGFIAQELEQVFPDMIEEWRDPVPEGEEPYKAVNANLIPVLVKAIQEQQALIESLTDRISALEGAKA